MDTVNPRMARERGRIMGTTRKPPDRTLNMAFPVPFVVRNPKGIAKIHIRIGSVPVFVRGVRRSEFDHKAAGIMKFENKTWVTCGSIGIDKDLAREMSGDPQYSRYKMSVLRWRIPKQFHPTLREMERPIPKSHHVVDVVEEAAALQARHEASETLYDGVFHYRPKRREGRLPGCPIKVTFELHSMVNEWPMDLYDMATDAARDPHAEGLVRPFMEQLESLALLRFVQAAQGRDYAETIVMLRRVALILSQNHPNENARMDAARRARAMETEAGELLDPGATLPEQDLDSLLLLG
jgi:hypothetical protein